MDGVQQLDNYTAIAVAFPGLGPPKNGRVKALNARLEAAVFMLH
jgi:hypothetical protein